MGILDDLGLRANVFGRSWESCDWGVYCFEAIIDGEAVELRICEDVAFYFLNAWTPNTAKCLEILRLHRTDLARVVDWKLRCGERTGEDRVFALNALDFYGFADQVRAVRRARDAVSRIAPMSLVADSELVGETC